MQGTGTYGQHALKYNSHNHCTVFRQLHQQTLIFGPKQPRNTIQYGAGQKYNMGRKQKIHHGPIAESTRGGNAENTSGSHDVGHPKAAATMR